MTCHPEPTVVPSDRSSPQGWGTEPQTLFSLGGESKASPQRRGSAFLLREFCYELWGHHTSPALERGISETKNSSGIPEGRRLSPAPFQGSFEPHQKPKIERDPCPYRTSLTLDIFKIRSATADQSPATQPLTQPQQAPTAPPGCLPNRGPRRNDRTQNAPASGRFPPRPRPIAPEAGQDRLPESSP